MDELPDTEWRLYFALARFAALRVPSESAVLSWSDVNFDRAMLNVSCVKTARHAGHERRMVPICPELAELLHRRFDEMPAGAGSICNVRGPARIRKVFLAACNRAGVEPWPKMMQTLRSSCEVEWAQTLPQYAVSKMAGHSITFSGKHYLNSIPERGVQQGLRQGGANSGARR